MIAASLFEFADGVATSASIDSLRPENPALDHGDDRIRVMGTDGSIEVRDDDCVRSTPPTGTETFDRKTWPPCVRKR